MSKIKPVFIQALVLAIAAIMLLVLSGPYHFADRPINFDEGDYLIAAERGIYNNALDEGSLSASEFIKYGESKLNGTDYRHAHEKKDLFLLRHFHPPMPLYPYALFVGYTTNKSIEEWMHNYHMTNTVLSIGIVLCLIIFTYLTLDLFIKSNILHLVFICALYLSPLFALNLTVLQFHSFLLLCTPLLVYCFCAFVKNPSKSNALIFGLAIGLCISSLESWPILVASLVVTIISNSVRRSLSISNLIIIVITSISITFLFWPASFIKIGIIKQPLMYAYRLFVKSGEEYSKVSGISHIANILNNNPAIVLIFSGSLFIYVRYFRWWVEKYLLLILVFIGSLVYMAAMIPFAVSASYFYPCFGLLMVGSLIGLVVYLDSKTRYIKAASGLIILTLVLSWVLYPKPQVIPDWPKDYAIIRVNTYQKKALIDNLAVVSLYSGIPFFENDAPHFPYAGSSNIYVRRDGGYLDVTSDILEGRYNVMVFRKSYWMNKSSLPIWRKIDSSGFVKRELEDYVIFAK